MIPIIAVLPLKAWGFISNKRPSPFPLALLVFFNLSEYFSELCLYSSDAVKPLVSPSKTSSLALFVQLILAGVMFFSSKVSQVLSPSKACPEKITLVSICVWLACSLSVIIHFFILILISLLIFLFTLWISSIFWCSAPLMDRL